MELFVQCAAIGVITAIAALTLRRHVPEISMLMIVVAGALILGAVSGVFSRVTQFLRDLAGTAGIAPEVLAPLLKATAIAVITKLACDICRESGAAALSSAIELCGCVIAVCISLPLLSAVMKLVCAFGA